jgi:hypothetical protein
MEIRFSMTPRLIGLALGCSLLLLVLVFTLGFLFGQRLKAVPPDTAARGGAAPASMPGATGAASVASPPQLPPAPVPTLPATPTLPSGR